jgi:hypothetical protein
VRTHRPGDEKLTIRDDAKDALVALLRDDGANVGLRVVAGANLISKQIRSSDLKIEVSTQYSELLATSQELWDPLLGLANEDGNREGHT